MRMKSVCGLLLATLLIGAMLSCSNSSGVGATGTGFVWVATEGDQRVQAFNINQSNGSIGAVGSSQPTGVQPTAMALTPDGKTLFIANTSDNTVSSYAVNSDGSLAAPTCPNSQSACTLVSVPAGEGPSALAVDPSGKLLFVASQGSFSDPISGTISVFNIQNSSLTAAGAITITNVDLTSNTVTVSASNTFTVGDIVRLEGLTTSTYLNNQTVAVASANASQFTFNFTHANDQPHVDAGTASKVFLTSPQGATGTGPSAVLASPAGNFLYVANQFSNTVQAFSYDASTGTPSPIGFPSTVGSNPSALAFSRCAGITTGTTSCPAADGNNLFVTNSGSNNVSIFTACIQLSTTCSVPNGHLAPVSSSPVAAGNSPVAIFVQPVLNFVYAVNSKGNNVTQYRYSSATGALTTLSPAAVNAGANPVGGGVTSDGTYVVVSNNNGSSMSVFSVGPGGKLAPGTTASVTLAGQPAAILVR